MEEVSMVEQFSSMMSAITYVLPAKFILNDIPHAAGMPAELDYSRPATPGQLHYTASLCQQLKIQRPYEEEVKTFGGTGRMVRELEAEKKHRKNL